MIAQKIRELREAFLKQYGLDVDVHIDAHSRSNPEVDMECAERLGLEMARELGESARSGHNKENTTRWYQVEDDLAEVNITLFYPDKGGRHGSSTDL